MIRMPSLDNARDGVELTPQHRRLFPNRKAGVQYYRGVRYLTHLSNPPDFTPNEWEERIDRLAERAEQGLPLFLSLTEGGGLAR